MADNKPEAPMAEAKSAAVNISKDVPWYLPSINPKLMRPALVDLLEKYAGIPREQQEQHLHEVVLTLHPFASAYLLAHKS